MSNQAITQRYIEVTANDLPLTCPRPQDSHWDSHPKVSIAFKHGNEERCPYCGTVYKFKGELPAHH